MKLHEIAKTIRSKNAGNYFLTMDVIFSDRQRYEHVKRSGALTRERVAELYRIPLDEVAEFVWYDPGLAVKATIRRPLPSGNPGETDVYGCQQFIPLLDVEVPDVLPD